MDARYQTGLLPARRPPPTAMAQALVGTRPPAITDSNSIAISIAPVAEDDSASEGHATKPLRLDAEVWSRPHARSQIEMNYPPRLCPKARMILRQQSQTADVIVHRPSCRGVSPRPIGERSVGDPDSVVEDDLPHPTMRGEAVLVGMSHLVDGARTRPDRDGTGCASFDRERTKQNAARFRTYSRNHVSRCRSLRTDSGPYAAEKPSPSTSAPQENSGPRPQPLLWRADRTRNRVRSGAVASDCPDVRRAHEVQAHVGRPCHGDRRGEIPGWDPG